MDDASRSLAERRAWSPYLGLGLTAALLVVAEELQHIIKLEQLAVAVFLLALVPIAYTSLVGGFLWGLIATLPVAIYTLHFVGPHGTILSLDAESIQGALIIAFLGVGMSYPMSRVKRREDALRASLTTQNAELSRRNKELSESNATLEAFGYVVSHDLKEPVRAMENYLEAALEEYPSAEARTFVEEAHRANKRLSKMLQGLLEYSRTSSSAATLRPQRIEEVIDSETCRSQYDRILRERGASLDVMRGIPPVLGDEVILAQLFGNLILNAIRHNAADKAHVTIRGEAAPPGRVIVVIADNGPGFPPEVLARFANVRGGRPATVKGGFGLVITKRAAERLGGRVSIKNVPGRGGEVRVDLPAAASLDGGGALPPAQARRAGPSAVITRGAP